MRPSWKPNLPSPAMCVAILALIVACAGTGYAASKLAKNSVGTKQLKKNAVVSKKVKDGSLLAGDFQASSLPKGPKGDQGPRGLTGLTGSPGRSALTPLRPGETVRGSVGFDGNAGAPGEDFAGAAYFPIPPSNAPSTIYIDGISAGENCTGSSAAPTAPADTVCVYDTGKSSGTFNATPIGGGNFGFTVSGTATGAGDIFFFGNWAFTEG